MTQKPEIVSPKYLDFFREESFSKRWEALSRLYKEDYQSYRLLFTLEVLATLENYDEPKPEALQKMLSAALSGTQYGIHIDRIFSLIQAVWPLEMAKQDVHIFVTFSEAYSLKDFFFTNIKLWSTALLQTWWAFETLLNDFASIILEQRKDKMDAVQSLLLSDKRVFINDKGVVQTVPANQSLEARIQFLYNFFTNETIDRSGAIWSALVNLKRTRDSYTHRIGEFDKPGDLFLDKKVLVDGISAVRQIVQNIFLKTPEFAGRYIYKFLAYWSCNTDLPFVWDSKSGGSVYLGLMEANPAFAKDLFAPVEGLFHEIDQTHITSR